MGSENSALKSYTLKEPPFILPSGLAVYPAVLQDGKFASVFVYKRENEDKVNKAAKHLKTLRHPCLLRFLSCTVEADGIHLVTERVQPLEVALETLSSAEVCAGIYDILLALIFLHDRGQLTHNNVCLSSVFVSEDGHWKLGAMETVCKISQATPEFLRSIQSIRDPASIPPEEMSPEFTTLPECHGHARDAFSFGTLVESLLTILNEQVSADVLSSFQQTLHSTLLNPIPNCRPALCTLLSHEFFRNDFLEVVNFLKSLTLKSEEEKTEFFKFLLDRVSCLSEELIASRLVPLLLNQLVFAEPVAVKSFLPHLLGPKKVLLGLRDTSDSIVAITLHSLAVLVSLLGPEVVVGGERTKIFKRTAPSFTKNIDLSLEGDPFSQPIKFPINGLSDVKNSLEDSKNFPSSSKKSEEWPDWSEPEEPENQTVNIQIWPREPCDAVKSQCTTLDMEESSWDDCEPSNLDTKVNPGGGITATKSVTLGEQKPIPALLPLTEESMPWKSSLPQKTSLVQSGDDPDQIKPPKVSSQERPLKVPSELGLGEEFTIQVKKKPVKDPEMDWFADMIPEIKPSAAFLILPELRTEMVPKKDEVSPVMQFSSKFAAAEITEGEAEGWEEEGELNWEDNNW
uniref:SCY1 like pseudokinase 3 n=1 Tax=Mandrillus leucophaeus TaxID=9568 RepID=A0A2K5ZJS2_MANLE